MPIALGDGLDEVTKGIGGIHKPVFRFKFYGKAGVRIINYHNNKYKEKE